MEITPKLIPHIEKAIGFRLYGHQIDYLLDIGELRNGRGTGKTTAYCIKLSLTNGEALDIRKPEVFSDRRSVDYSRGFFKREFMDIRNKLKTYGFPVREIKGGN